MDRLRAKGLAQARQTVPDAPIAAISVDAQAHGLVPVDAAGTVIRPAKLWNDTTSAAEARELVDRLGRHEWVQAHRQRAAGRIHHQQGAVAGAARTRAFRPAPPSAAPP